MTRKRTAMILGGGLGVVALTLVLAGVLHDGGTAEAQGPPASYTKVSMPDFGQHSTGWCWVAAAANSFWWYAENVAGQEGLLGGVGTPWKNTDPNSQIPPPPANPWYDANDIPQGYPGPLPIPGYRKLLSMIAGTTFKDSVVQNGIKDPGENNYVFSEGVEKWDYLIGLRDYVNNYGSDLVVHDIIDPLRCTPGNYGMKPDDRVPPPTFNTLNPCGPGGSGVPGVSQVVLPPTFTDYRTELSAGQDVLLWMESTSPETAHVVTGVAYDTVPNPDTITISDPWTRNALPPVAPHDDTWNMIAPLASFPSHNNASAHAPSPYNVCTVVSPGPAPKFTINCGGTIWTVYDMIFVSPAEPTPYKCYQIGGPPIGATVELQTMFGVEPDVQVISPAFLCEPALKNGEGDLSKTPYKAYMIADTHDPNAVVDLKTQFGVETKLEVGPALFLWEPALKTFEGGPEGDLSQTPYKCYAISDSAPDVDPVNLETQFGVEQGVVVGPAQLLCEPALRDGFGDPTQSPYKCYQITDQTAPGAVVDLETHFGVEQGVVVGPPAFLCEPAARYGAVGGLAQLPGVAADSGSSTGTYAALAGGLAAALVILSAGAWYARRRWVR